MTLTTRNMTHILPSVLIEKPGLARTVRTLPRNTRTRTPVRTASNKLDMGSYRQTRTQWSNYVESAERKLLYMVKVKVIGFRTSSIMRKNASSALTTSVVVVNTSLSSLWN